MPIAEITVAVNGLANPPAVRVLLAEHLRRLEDGLAAARRELSHAHTLLMDLENPMTRVTLPAPPTDSPGLGSGAPPTDSPGLGSGTALAAAIEAVRFAVGADPNLPMLSGILFETSEDTLTLVATDRFRLAVASVPAVVDGPPVRVVVPAELVDRAGQAGEITLGPDHVSLGDVEGKPLDVDFPDYRRLVGEPRGPRVTVDVAELRAAIAAQPELWREHEGTTYPVSILGVDPEGSLRLAEEAEWTADQDAHVAVNREFLLQALDAGGAGQLQLHLDGPIKPLAVRVPGADRFSLLMPVRH